VLQKLDTGPVPSSNPGGSPTSLSSLFQSAGAIHVYLRLGCATGASSSRKSNCGLVDKILPKIVSSNAAPDSHIAFSVGCGESKLAASKSRGTLS
jgi:hypothetical protein